MNTAIVFVHGAYSSSTSFNYIKHCCQFDNVINLDYSISKKFSTNLESMKSTLEFFDDPLFFIAHSLGGIYALHLADHFNDRCQGGITLSTPYGGSQLADFLKYFVANDHFYREIGTHGDPITYAEEIKIQWPWVNLVSTHGQVPWIIGNNDGVVSIASMTHNSDIETEEIAATHHEILMHQDTINIILDRTQHLK